MKTVHHDYWQQDTPKISLDEQDFKALMMGKIIYANGVQVALSDIGFNRMAVALKEAYKNTVNKS